MNGLVLAVIPIYTSLGEGKDKGVTPCVKSHFFVPVGAVSYEHV